VDAGGHLMGIAATIYLVFFWAFVYFNVDFNTLHVRDHAYDVTFARLLICLPIHLVLSIIAALKSYWWLAVMVVCIASALIVVARWFGY
jgi:hypothetical protein